MEENCKLYQPMIRIESPEIIRSVFKSNKQTEKFRDVADRPIG